METTPATAIRRTKPRERNSLLKKYYGLKEAPMKQTSEVTEERLDPFNLDGNTFNSSAYFANLLKREHLQGLIEKDNELVGADAEIREIDGEMKNLVYENYSKFISATDTIRKMKSNVESMESEMSRLNENIAEISKQSKIINEEMGPNRKKIQQLSNVHNSLKRLQFIFELPNRLQHCLTKRKYAQAVKYYFKASKLLNHYQHMAAFKGIERDCDQIMEKVKVEIWKGMTTPEVNLQKVAEETKLLVLLGEDPHKLWKKYIEIQILMLKKKQNEHSTPENVEKLITLYITPLEDIVKHFENLFLNPTTQNTLDHQLSSLPTLSEHEMTEATSDLLTSIDPYISHFFALASKFIQLPADVSSISLIQKQQEYISQLNNALSLDHIQSLISIAKLDKKMYDLTAEWENELVNKLFDSCLTGLKSYVATFVVSLQEIAKDQDTFEFNFDGIADFIQDTQTWLIDRLANSCLLPLKNCLNISNVETLGRIQSGLKLVWQKIADFFTNKQENTELNESALKILILVESRLCYDLADNGIFQVYSTFSTQLCSEKLQSKKLYNVPETDEDIDTRIIPDMNTTIEYYLNAGQTLLRKQMMHDGYRLSANIEEAYLHRKDGPVSQVSEIWFLVYNNIKYIERLVDAVYPQQQQNTPQRLSIDNSESEYDYGPYPNRNVLQSTHSITTVSSMSEIQHLPPLTKFGNNDITLNMMNNIDKLFAERVDVYRKVDPTSMGVCKSLILILLKAFLEVTRTIQMNTICYQQIQVDLEYIKRIIWPFAGDEKWFITLLQEVLSGVYLRCNSPISLNQDEIALILTP